MGVFLPFLLPAFVSSVLVSRDQLSVSFTEANEDLVMEKSGQEPKLFRRCLDHRALIFIDRQLAMNKAMSKVRCA